MRLYLIRHGKAERDAPSGRDEDRALADRGRAQAKYLGEWLAALPVADRPRIILTSPAVRARETARLIADRLSIRVDFEKSLSLLTTFEAASECVARVASAGVPAVLVGHNPTMEVLVDVFGGGPDHTMRTGEAAILEVQSGGKNDSSIRCVGRVRLDE